MPGWSQARMILVTDHRVRGGHVMGADNQDDTWCTVVVGVYQVLYGSQVVHSGIS